ncbi:UNVERIFIED_CONTAM: hypothetical protein K2H54_013439 [Gekko kuhli]
MSYAIWTELGEQQTLPLLSWNWKHLSARSSAIPAQDEGRLPSSTQRGQPRKLSSLKAPHSAAWSGNPGDLQKGALTLGSSYHKKSWSCYCRARWLPSETVFQSPYVKKADPSQKRKDKSRPKSLMTILSITTNISLTTLPITDAASDRYDNPNYTCSSFANYSINTENVSVEISSHNTTDYGREKSIVNSVVLSVSIWVICIFGAAGNGIVIRVLGFRVKRNPFSTYILHLAIADLGVLLSVTFIAVDLWIAFVYGFPIMITGIVFPFLLMYSTSQFLLTAISIDRCVAVFFPLWHRCHRPPHLSTTVCAAIWFLSFLLTAITYTLMFLHFRETKIEEYYQFLVNAILCLPVMMIATGALFIKVCLKARQHRKGKLLTIVLLTLLFFLLFAFPFNVLFILYIFGYLPPYVLRGAMLLICLNSSINPAIYVLVGRQGRSRQRESMKLIFQKVFKEEERCTGGSPVETQL